MNSATLVITSTKDVSDQLRQELEEATKVDVEVADSEGLDGMQSTLLVLQISSALVSTVVPIIKLYLDQKKVTRVGLGDEAPIDNPKAEQVDALLKEILAESNKSE